MTAYYHKSMENLFISFFIVLKSKYQVSDTIIMKKGTAFE